MKKLPFEALLELEKAIFSLKSAKKEPDNYDFWISQANQHLARANSAYSKALILHGGAR